LFVCLLLLFVVVGGGSGGFRFRFCFVFVVAGFCFVFKIFFNTSLSLVGSSGRLTSVEQRYPFLSVCVVFSCVQTMVRLPVFEVFNVGTDNDACDLARWLYEHRDRVNLHCKLILSENSIAAQWTRTRVNIVQSDSLPTELFPPLPDTRP